MSDLEPITQEETAWANGDIEPVTRKEQYLNRLTGEEQTIPETPVTRIEQYLARLCGMETEIPSGPITREETYLAYLNGENVTLPEPITRLEQFMAFAAEKSETKPTPLTREEFYWDKYQGGAVLKDFPGLPSSIVTVTDALAKPLNSLKVAITPVQSGSGDPSPDNIRPISGWTGMNVWQSGKNLWGGEKLADDIVAKVNGAVKNATAKTITYRASAITDVVLFEKFNPNTQYTVILNGTGYANMKFMYSDGTSEVLAGRLSTTSEASTSNHSKSITALAGSWSSGQTVLNYEQCGIFEGNIAVDNFTPYTGQDYSITFPSEAGTVYGGTLDVTSGTLTVTDVVTTIGDMNWSYQSASERFRSDSIASVSKGSLVCECFKRASASALEEYSIGSASNGVVLAKSTDYTTPTDFVGAYGAYKLKYALKTPITYQLTPTEVQMLLGTNNLWADTGDILEGKYWGKKSSATQTMLNTLRSAGEVTEITPTEEPEELEETEEEEPEESDER